MAGSSFAFRLWVIVPVLLLGAALRFQALSVDVRLHPDEAFFADFAREAAVHGNWLLPGDLDKPPLSIYAAALSMQFVGVETNAHGVLDLDLQRGEFAARLPNTLIGIVFIALVYVVAWRLYRSSAAALFAGLLCAVSPQLVAFTATALTDTMMLTFAAASVLGALRDRWAWSGGLLALSFAGKPQGVFYLGLLFLIAVQVRPNRPQLIRFGMAFGVGILLLLLWDALRPGVSIFSVAASNNDPERLFVQAGELLPRLQAWAVHTDTLFGVPMWTAALMVMGAIVGWSEQRSRPWLLFAAGYVVIHLIFAFNTYDRYVLLTVLPLALLAGRGLAWLCRSRRVLLIGSAVVIMLCGLAERSGIPSEDRDFDRQWFALSERLNALPLGTIVYDRWLGWQLDYYLGAWTDKRRVYYPTPQALAADAPRNPETAPRYLVAPAAQDVEPWLSAVREKGFTTEITFTTGRYTVYRLTPPVNGARARFAARPAR